MAEHNKYGAAAEQAVQDYLKAEGYEIRHINWRYGHKELDLVAIDSHQLVIVEVKARKTSLFGQPTEAVSDLKIRRTISAANAYIKQHNIDRDVRFDVVSVLTNEDSSLAIEHIKDAFFPPIS